MWRCMTSCLLVLGSAFSLGGCAEEDTLPTASGDTEGTDSSAPVEWAVAERLLLAGDQAASLVPGSWRVSSDGRRFAYVLERGTEHILVVDGVEETIRERSPPAAPHRSWAVRTRAEAIRLETLAFSG